MTIDKKSDAPRWGGVAHGSDTESREKPQELSGLDFQPPQVHAASGVNASGTCEESGTPLTQPAGDLFAVRADAVSSGPCVYFITDGEAIKIGFSENVAKRFGGLQTGHPRKLELLAYVSITEITEADAQERFAHLKLRGEWYRPAPELLAFIDGFRTRHPGGVEASLESPVIALARRLVEVGRNDPDSGIRSRTQIIAKNCRELEAEPGRPGLRELTLRNIRGLSDYRAERSL